MNLFIPTLHGGVCRCSCVHVKSSYLICSFNFAPPSRCWAVVGFSQDRVRIRMCDESWPLPTIRRTSCASFALDWVLYPLGWGVGLALGSSPKTGIAPVRKQSRVTVVGSRRPPSPLGMEYKAALPSTHCRYLALVSSHSITTCFVDSSAPFSILSLNGLSSRRPVVIGPILSFNPCSGLAGWSRATKAIPRGNGTTLATPQLNTLS